MIRIENLSFGYCKKNILKNINLSFKEGSFTGILGPNGSGKSTLLKNILGYLKPNSGSVFINDENINHMKRKEYAKLVGFVPQKSGFSMAVSVEEFILLGRIPHLKNKWNGFEKNDREITDEIIKQMNLEKFRERNVLTLSGGEFQRVLVARALCQQPKILLLDEPTSALDLNYAVELLGVVKELSVYKGITVVTVLHDLNLASFFCSDLVLMKNGGVYMTGNQNNIIDSDVLKDVYGFDSKIIEDGGIPYIIPVCKSRGVLNV